MSEQMTEGREFTGRARQISQVRMLVFSGGALDAPGWPARNLHTDADKAAEAGLAAPIASGVQCEADIIRLLTELFGAAWFQHGKLEVKYPRPVFAGTTVRPHACVRAARDATDGTRVELDVSCKALDDTVVVVGTASCLIQPRGSQ